MTPLIEITVDGKPVSGLFYSRLISVSVTDKEGTRSDTVTLKLDDSNPFAEIPRRGAKISVSMGYVESGVKSMGDFVVDEVEIECLPYALSIQGNPANVLKPSSVTVAMSIALPIQLASQWEGYFTMGRKDGLAIDDRCGAIGVPFIVRVIAGGQYGIEITPEDAMKIWTCQ